LPKIRDSISGSMKPEEIIEKIFEAVTNSPINLYGICRKTKLHPRTAKRYLGIIESVQAKEKIEKEWHGLRAMMRKKRQR